MPIDEELAVKLLRARLAEWNESEGKLLDGYEYEKRFIEVFNSFQLDLFRNSLGLVPKNKNEKKNSSDQSGQG